MTKSGAGEPGKPGDIAIKRVYDRGASSDGRRVLVDRVWPRGIRKEEANLSCWMKDIAPSTELRKWFGHDPEKWREFRGKYEKELKDKRGPVEQLLELSSRGRVTLLYAAKDEQHNHARVIREYLKKKIGS